ncbi:MAG: hypothetical protein ACM3MH_11050 [Actinomycetota bacterium]
MILATLAVTALGAALFLRYDIIQNTPIGLACEAGEASFTCKLRLVVIIMFVNECFGWTALIAAMVQLWRPNMVVLGVGLVFALLGLVLYNTRVAALAITLLVLSFARPRPATK